MSDIVVSCLLPAGPDDHWVCAELDLDQRDIDIIAAALWVARRDLGTWVAVRDSRVERLRRFFNAPNVRSGEVTLYARADPALPREST